MHNGRYDGNNDCDSWYFKIKLLAGDYFQTPRIMERQPTAQNEEMYHSPHLTGFNLRFMPFIGLLVIVPATTTFSFGSAI
jgi:hypothetical protein